MTGMIMLWSGSIGSIPGGWALCNGSNGTPDLRDRFVVGAGSAYAVGATGGAVNHTHGGTTNGHSHDLEYGYGDIYSGSSNDYDNQTMDQSDTFTTNLADSRPPYYALAYIMKL